MENLTNLGTIKRLCSEYGFHFSKSKGQNFLVNPTVCPRMAELSGAGKGIGVLEIGPGFGVLTAELAKAAEKVVAVELDERLKPVLTHTLDGFSNVEVVYGDVLGLDLHALLASKLPGLKTVVCANLPYYITSPVLMRLLESRLPVDSITVMVQKETAQRLCTEPGNRLSGAVTIAVRYYSLPEMLFSVSKGSFYPSPKVDSSVIRLRVLKQPPVSVTDEQLFFRIVRAAFSQRRKTVLNALSGGLGLPKQQVAEMLDAAQVHSMARAEALTMEDFAQISEFALRALR